MVRVRMQISKATKLAQLVFILGVAVSRLAAQTGAPNGVANPSFSLSISALADNVKTGDQIKVNVTIKNISNRDIRLWTDSRGVEVEYKVNITDQKGNAPPDAKFKRDIKGLEDPAYLTPDTPLNFSGGMRTLKPTEVLTDLFNVSRLYDLTQAGKYNIQLRRMDDASSMYITSNTIAVTITP